jgi:hypothetical protein
MTTLRGRCLCGDVRFEIRGDLGVFTLCHCGACRKAQGSAFVAAAPVRVEDFVLLGGDGSLTAYESSPGKERVFCSRCGSPIFSRRASKADVVRIRIGTLESPVGRRPDCHIFVGDRADWDDHLDTLPAFDGFESGRTG